MCVCLCLSVEWNVHLCISTFVQKFQSKQKLVLIFTSYGGKKTENKVPSDKQKPKSKCERESMPYWHQFDAHFIDCLFACHKSDQTNVSSRSSSSLLRFHRQIRFRCHCHHLYCTPIDKVCACVCKWVYIVDSMGWQRAWRKFQEFFSLSFACLSFFSSFVSLIF